MCADAIEAYLEGRISNMELDDSLYEVAAVEDTDCGKAREFIWNLYCDFRQHYNTGTWKLDEQPENTARQWVKLLRTPI